jgi:hypothetical protein
MGKPQCGTGDSYGGELHFATIHERQLLNRTDETVVFSEKSVKRRAN